MPACGLKSFTGRPSRPRNYILMYRLGLRFGTRSWSTGGFFEVQHGLHWRASSHPLLSILTAPGQRSTTLRNQTHHFTTKAIRCALLAGRTQHGREQVRLAGRPPMKPWGWAPQSVSLAPMHQKCTERKAQRFDVVLEACIEPLRVILEWLIICAKT